METCYKLFKTEIIQGLSLQQTRFGFEPEVTAKTAKIKDIRIYEVGISYYGRTYEEGKKIGWKDGVSAIYCIVKYGLFGQKKFLAKPLRHRFHQKAFSRNPNSYPEAKKLF